MSKKKPKPTPNTQLTSDVSAVNEATKRVVEKTADDSVAKVYPKPNCLMLRNEAGVELGFDPINLMLPALPIPPTISDDYSILGGLVECSFEQYVAATEFLSKGLTVTVRFRDTRIVFNASHLTIIKWKHSADEQSTALIGMKVEGIVPK